MFSRKTFIFGLLKCTDIFSERNSRNNSIGISTWISLIITQATNLLIIWLCALNMVLLLPIGNFVALLGEVVLTQTIFNVNAKEAYSVFRAM